MCVPHPRAQYSVIHQISTLVEKAHALGDAATSGRKDLMQQLATALQDVSITVPTFQLPPI
jgi:hypothetical protein